MYNNWTYGSSYAWKYFLEAHKPAFLSFAVAWLEGKPAYQHVPFRCEDSRQQRQAETARHAAQGKVVRIAVNADNFLRFSTGRHAECPLTANVHLIDAWYLKGVLYEPGDVRLCSLCKHRLECSVRGTPGNRYFEIAPELKPKRKARAKTLTSSPPIKRSNP